MTVRKFFNFNLLESAGYLVDVDVYTGDDCEGAEEMLVPELMSSKYANRKLLGFDVGSISITVEEGDENA